ncbi:hypothetical protein [Pseudoxanthomonas suwonensis]|uniref:hypothetical protein n=1 Tax=Pseudoxanthomonas suwonensis TaxID=314722 RepID=UPI000466784C|nr:hypothetical protein [Pseudoxanthomonas suwonensis]
MSRRRANRSCAVPVDRALVRHAIAAAVLAGAAWLAWALPLAPTSGSGRPARAPAGGLLVHPMAGLGALAQGRLQVCGAVAGDCRAASASAMIPPRDTLGQVARVPG